MKFVEVGTLIEWGTHYQTRTKILIFFFSFFFFLILNGIEFCVDNRENIKYYEFQSTQLI